jgi:hypothetical protein
MAFVQLYSQEVGTTQSNLPSQKTYRFKGVYATGTNNITTQLESYSDADGVMWISVAIGSLTTNSAGHYYCAPPDCKFSKFELKDKNGNIVAPIVCDLVTKMPDRIKSDAMPRWENHGHEYKNRVGFETNLSPVDYLIDVKLRSIYKITTNDTYTLTVCPVIYELETNWLFFKRVDLACVSTNIFLSVAK